MSCPGAARRGAGVSPSDSPLTGQRLTRACRILRRAEFQRVYDRGRRAAGVCFVVFGEPNDLGFPRLGVTATRKLGGAVARNRIKRMLREIFRRHRPSLEPALDVVVNARSGVLDHPYAEMEREFLDAYRSLARRFRT